MAGRHLPSSVVSIVLLASLWAVDAAAQQARPERAPDSDQTVDVSRGTRLTVDNFAGEVVIRTWERDALRVMARHSSRTRVNIRTTAAGVSVGSSGGAGPSSVDYQITAPAWMPVKIDGTYNHVSIEGAQAEISATTVRGDIVIKGGSGYVTAKSIEGEVVVDGAKGRITVESVNERIRISNASGDIIAQTTNGDILMSAVSAASVEAGTVNGDVTFDGGLSAGRYRFQTHNGDIMLTIPESSNATFAVRTYNGDFQTNLPLKGATPADARRGRRAIFTIGTGSAEVELETFGGEIRIQRPGAAGTGPRRDRDQASGR